MMEENSPLKAWNTAAFNITSARHKEAMIVSLVKIPISGGRSSPNAPNNSQTLINLMTSTGRAETQGKE